MAIEGRTPAHSPGEAGRTHFFAGPGPMDVRPVRSYVHRGFRVTHEFRFYLDRVEGVGRKAFLGALYAVLFDPRGWMRSGVRWVRTLDRSRADVLLRCVPDGQTVCGEGAAGCYSWPPPAAEIEAQYVGTRIFPVLVGMELCGHATFRMSDHYVGSAHNAAAYHGQMGNVLDPEHPGGHYWPSDAEIEAAKTWLRGETDPALIHDEEG